MAILIGVAILAIGAGAAAAIVLAGEGGTSTTTVLVGKDRSAADGVTAGTSTEAATGSIELGRYVQAGSFKTVSHAETERERLAAAGVDVEVASSDIAQELYPGFQVLLAGPFDSREAETSLLNGLHRNGVPSAFGRELTPALGIGGPEAIEGSWSGEVARSSEERPGLAAALPVTLTIEPGGEEGVLDFPDLGCQTALSLVSENSAVLTYRQTEPCAAGGVWHLRLSGEELMLALLPPGNDVFVLGTIGRS